MNFVLPLTLILMVSTYPLVFAQEFDTPKWISVVLTWHEEGQISEKEFANFASYLKQKGIFNSSNFEEKSKHEYKIMITKGEKHIVPLDKIKRGGPPPDGIPSIDAPKFVLGNEADFVNPSDLVIGVNYNSHARAYPLFIMNWHEIVNDNFGQVPLAITYCPLCFTSQVFERELDGQPVEFGTSGMLYNSNLVMYDRFTNSLWSQGLGVAIKGELSGDELTTIPFDVMRWSDWISLYPETVVLSMDTGHQRPYSSDPYSDYFKDPRILFSIENQDDRLPIKEIIFGFEDDGNYKAYTKDDVESMRIINDSIGGKNIVLISTVPFMARSFDRNFGDQVLDFKLKENQIIDTQTQSIWNLEGEAIEGSLKGAKLERMTFHPGFWFEWASFHPTTEIYGTS